jgi:hypothetical protein
MRKRLETETKVKQQKELKEKSELIGCTFHPTLQTNMSNQYFQNYLTRGINGLAYKDSTDDFEVNEDYQPPVMMMNSNINF